MKEGIDIAAVQEIQRWREPLELIGYQLLTVIPPQKDGLGYDRGMVVFGNLRAGLEAFVVHPHHFFGPMSPTNRTKVYATHGVVEDLRRRGYAGRVGPAPRVRLDDIEFPVNEIDGMQVYALVSNGHQQS